MKPEEPSDRGPETFKEVFANLQKGYFPKPYRPGRTMARAGYDVPGFDEGQHPRAGKGKFAKKPPAPKVNPEAKPAAEAAEKKETEAANVLIAIRDNRIDGILTAGGKPTDEDMKVYSDAYHEMMAARMDHDDKKKAYDPGATTFYGTRYNQHGFPVYMTASPKSDTEWGQYYQYEADQMREDSGKMYSRDPVKRAHYAAKTEMFDILTRRFGVEPRKRDLRAL